VSCALATPECAARIVATVAATVPADTAYRDAVAVLVELRPVFMTLSHKEMI
jgi:hypothetical protein